MRRVVITGVGAISPLGLSAQDSWDNCVEGVSGVAPITLFDSSEFLVQIACEVKGFDPKEHMSPANARRRDRCQQLAVAAGKQAILQKTCSFSNEKNSFVSHVRLLLLLGLCQENKYLNNIQ